VLPPNELADMPQPGRSSFDDMGRGRWPALLLAVVNLATVTEGHDDNEQHVIGNCVDDAVVADANP
jgi:hypothetical protein